MLTDVTPDHVAVAVPDLDAAMPRWETTLGGRTSGWFSNGIFRSRQLRYRNGTKVELIAPHEDDESADNFVRHFLERRGSTIHHVTLKVPEIHAAVAQAEAAGFDVVDLDASNDLWREAFLRPSQVGGVIVQLAENNESDRAWAARVGCDYLDPPADGAEVLGPVIRHPNLDAAREVWTKLGAVVTDDHVVTWATGALQVQLVSGGDRPTTQGVVIRGTRSLAADPVLGARVLPGLGSFDT